jgi:hypothetical protein
MATGPFTLARKLVTQNSFVDYWERFYRYRTEALYEDNIGRHLTPKRVEQLFEWKNGGRLSQLKAASIRRNFIDRIPEVERLDHSVDAASFLKRFGDGGAIWRIFWLHVWQPRRFPIYDQHVHRGMAWIAFGLSEEIPVRDSDKVRSYLERYLPFIECFEEVDRRRLDRALWACGKLMKPFSGARVDRC